MDLTSVRLDHWVEAFVGPVFNLVLYDLAFDLDHHDLHLEKVLLEHVLPSCGGSAGVISLISILTKSTIPS